MNLDGKGPIGPEGWLGLESHAHCSYSQVPRKSLSPFANLANLSPLPGHQGLSNLGFILPNRCYFVLTPAINWLLSQLRQEPNYICC